MHNPNDDTERAKRLKMIVQQNLGMNGVMAVNQMLVHAQRNSWIQDDWIGMFDRVARAWIKEEEKIK